MTSIRCKPHELPDRVKVLEDLHECEFRVTSIVATHYSELSADPPYRSAGYFCSEVMAFVERVEETAQ